MVTKRCIKSERPELGHSSTTSQLGDTFEQTKPQIFHLPSGYNIRHTDFNGDYVNSTYSKF